MKTIFTILTWSFVGAVGLYEQAFASNNTTVRCTYASGARSSTSINAPGTCPVEGPIQRTDGCAFANCKSETRYSDFVLAMDGIGAVNNKRVWKGVSTKTTTREITADGRHGWAVCWKSTSGAKNNCLRALNPEGTFREEVHFCPDGNKAAWYSAGGDSPGMNPDQKCADRDPNLLCPWRPPQPGEINELLQPDDYYGQEGMPAGASTSEYEAAYQAYYQNWRNCYDNASAAFSACKANEVSKGDCFCTSNNEYFRFESGTWKCTPCPEDQVQDRSTGNNCKSKCSAGSVWDPSQKRCISASACTGTNEIVFPQVTCQPKCEANQVRDTVTAACETKCAPDEKVIMSNGNFASCLKCASGTLFNKITQSCEPIVISQHNCGASGVAHSKDYNSILGNISSGDWSHLSNQMLACCMSSTGAGDIEKYHCGEMKPAATMEFSDYYNGVGANAIETAGLGASARRFYLTDSGGSPVVGLYRADGTRCTFTDSMSVSTLLTTLGTVADTARAGGEAARDPLANIQTASDADKRFCTVLVRAALETSCGPNGAVFSGRRRCPAASEVKVHYEIRDLTAGRKRQVIFKNVTTMGADGSGAAPINVRALVEASK